jgi:hypothetical protein
MARHFFLYEKDVFLDPFVIFFHLNFAITALALNLLLFRVFLDNKIGAGKCAIRHCAGACHFNESFVLAGHDILHIYENSNWGMKI